MKDFSILRHVASRLITQDLSPSRTSARIALDAVTILAKLLSNLTPMLGEGGSSELFRRSLRLTEDTFPFYKAARTAERSGLLAGVGVVLENQQPDVAQEAAIAILTAYLELLATFIGERLTWQLVQEAWPDLLITSSEEISNE